MKRFVVAVSRKEAEMLANNPLCRDAVDKIREDAAFRLDAIREPPTDPFAVTEEILERLNT